MSNGHILSHDEPQVFIYSSACTYMLHKTEFTSVPTLRRIENNPLFTEIFQKSLTVVLSEGTK